jgi:hypothetical protein
VTQIKMAAVPRRTADRYCGQQAQERRPRAPYSKLTR